MSRSLRKSVAYVRASAHIIECALRVGDVDAITHQYKRLLVHARRMARALTEGGQKPWQ